MNTDLEKQIEETMKKAFWDLIKKDLNDEPQRFDHLIKLIIEIRETLKGLTPKRYDIKTELDEVLDESFLKMLFVEKSLEPSHFINLILFLIKKIKSYSAPYLDEDIIRWEDEVLKELRNEIIYSTFVPSFFEKLYIFLDIIQQDMNAYFKEINKH